MGIFTRKSTQSEMNDARERAELRHIPGYTGNRAENTRVNNREIKWGGKFRTSREHCQWVGTYGRDGRKED